MTAMIRTKNLSPISQRPNGELSWLGRVKLNSTCSVVSSSKMNLIAADIFSVQASFCDYYSIITKTDESGDDSEDVVDDDRDRDLLLFWNLMCESEEASEELSATDSSEEDSSEEDSSEDAT